MLQQKESCPQASVLEDYLLGKLPPGQIESCERHIATCLICGDTIRGLGESPDDTFSRLASEVMADPPVTTESADKQAVDNLIARLKCLSAEPSKIEATRIAEDRAAEIQRLLEPSDVPESIGRIAHYDLLNLLGAGSTGVVYEAFDRRLERLVALKILRPSLGPTARERFIAEARAAAAIDHPNIVSIYEVDHDGPLAYMAMQRLPGQTLESRLEQVTFLPEEQVRNYARQVAEGLAAAHRKSLIHRDIKPANVWIDADRNQIKILDFGLARIADSDPNMTATGMLAGTPSYMSPEQTRGLELDRRSDLFSLGCLMYRAVTGRLPFSSTGILATLQAIQNDVPTPPAQLNPACSVDFSDLIMSLLEKQPASRPDSAVQLIEALDRPRDAWPFAVNAISESSISRPIAEHKTKMIGINKKSIARRSYAGWIGAAVVFISLGLGGYFFGSDIIRIATNQGELVIETDDPNIKVEVLQKGQVVRVIDTSTNDRIDIAAGEYSVRASSGESQFEISPAEVRLNRGEKQIVRVRKVALGSPDEAKNSSANAVNSFLPARTYDGRTFEEWLEVLRVEQYWETVCPAIGAVAELSVINKSKQSEALAAVTPIVRSYRDKEKAKSDTYVAAFRRFFETLDPHWSTEFTLQELRDGTESSRHFALTHLNSPTYVFLGDKSKKAIRVEALRESVGRFYNLTTELIERDAGLSEERTESAIQVTANVLYLVYGAVDESDKSVQTPSSKYRNEKQKLDDQIREAYRSATTAEKKAAFGLMLAAIAPKAPNLGYPMARLVLDKQVPARIRAFAFRAVEHIVPNDAADIIPAILQLVQNTDEYLSDGETQILLRLGDPIYASQTLITSDNWPERPRLILSTIQMLNYFGADAKVAIPWLESLVNNKNLRTDLTKPGRFTPDPAQVIQSEAKYAIAAIRTAIDSSAKPNEPNEPGPSTPLDSTSEIRAATFNGRTYAEWVELLKVERSVDAICSGLEAMAELSRDNAEMQKDLITTLTPFVRQYGAINVFGGSVLKGPTNTRDKFHETFLKVFSTFSPDQLVEFSLNEMSDGTKQSREFLFWLIIIGSVYEDDGERQDRHLLALLDNVSRFVDKALELLALDPTIADERTETSLIIVSDLLPYLFGPAVPFNQQPRQPIDLTKERPELVASIISAFRSTQTDESKAELGLLVALTAPDTPEIAKEMCHIVLNPSILGNRRAMAFRSLLSLAPRNPEIVVPMLVELGKNKDKYFSLEDQAKFASIGTGSFRLFNPSLQQHQPMEWAILGALRLFKKSATDAIPWLEELAKQQFDETVDQHDWRRKLKSNAEQLLKDIEAESADK